MKTKTLIMACLLLGIGITQLSAQLPDPPDNKNGTGVVSGWKSWADYPVEVFCSGEKVDMLLVDFDIHWLAHFNNFNLVFSHHNVKGVGISIGFEDGGGNKIGGTGEVFKVIDIPHKWDPFAEYQYEFVNCVGEQGTHYVMTLAWDNITYEMVVIKSVCPGSN